MHPTPGAPLYITQTLTHKKGEIDSNTIIVGDFNTPLTQIDRSSKQKMNKETQVLNDTHEMDLMAIFRTFHPYAKEYTVFSSGHGTFSMINHILGHKSNLSKFRKIEIIRSIFSDHKAMRLDINYKKKTAKNTNTWRLNNMFLNNQHVMEEIKGEIKKILETNDNENMTTQNLWDAAKAVIKGKFIAIQAYLKKLNRQPNFTTKTTGKRSPKKKKKNSRRKEIIKIRAEISKKEMKEMIAKINKTESRYCER